MRTFLLISNESFELRRNPIVSCASLPGLHIRDCKRQKINKMWEICKLFLSLSHESLKSTEMSINKLIICYVDWRKKLFWRCKALSTISSLNSIYFSLNPNHMELFKIRCSLILFFHSTRAKHHPPTLILLLFTGEKKKVK